MSVFKSKLKEQGNGNKPLLSAGVSHYIGKFRIELRCDGGLNVMVMPDSTDLRNNNIMVRPIVANSVAIYACR